jgi:hypothetical protein
LAAIPLDEEASSKCFLSAFGYAFIMTGKRASKQARLALDDDGISTASSQSEKYAPDQVFLVESIVAEKKDSDGRIKYLIFWAGYPEEKATWEPKKNIQDPDILRSWRKRKEQIAKNEQPTFDLVKFNAKLEEVKEAKKFRHRLRKIKRKRLGMKVSPNTSDSDSTEAIEEDDEPGDDLGIKKKEESRLPPQKPKKSTTQHPQSRPIQPVPTPQDHPIQPAPTPQDRPIQLTPTPPANQEGHDLDSDSSGLTDDIYVGDKKKAQKKAIQAIKVKRSAQRKASASEERAQYSTKSGEVPVSRVPHIPYSSL